MTPYEYVNEHERQATQKYEGTYTPEEIELNRQLKEECSKGDVNFAIVEEFLKRGADPLGGAEWGGWDLLEHLYGEIIADSRDSNSNHLPKLTELFLKYGMDVDFPRIPYDEHDSLNPIWFFTFAVNENSASALKLLLDHGLSADSFAEFWCHSITDFCHVACGDPENDEFWNFECVWTFKMILLGASYDRILENDEGLRELIRCNSNSSDVHMFRSWDDFEYRFDTSHCPRRPELYGSVLHIYAKKTGKEVWTIDVI